jgi:hypothetical protein
VTCVICYVAVAAGLVLAGLFARTDSVPLAVLYFALGIAASWLYVHETRRKIREAAARRDDDHD